MSFLTELEQKILCLYETKKAWVAKVNLEKEKHNNNRAGGIRLPISIITLIQSYNSQDSGKWH